MGEPEDLIDVGSAGPLRWDRWLRRRRGHRAAQAGALVVIAAAVAVALVLQNRHDTHRAVSTPQLPTRSSPPTTTTTSTPYVDNEYLIAVPAQDMRAEINRCGPHCVARSLTGSALLHAARTFPGLHPLAGGTVTRRGRLVLETIEGYAGQYAIAHLTVRLVTPPAPRTVRPMTDTVARPGYLTTTVTSVRGGCRLTAVLVARASVPSAAAARTWAASTLPDCG